MSLFLTGGRHSLIHSRVPGLKGTVAAHRFWGGRGEGGGRCNPTPSLRLARGNSRGSVCFWGLNNKQPERDINIEYIILIFKIFWLFSWWVIFIHLVFQLQGSSLFGSVAEQLSCGWLCWCVFSFLCWRKHHGKYQIQYLTELLCVYVCVCVREGGGAGEVSVHSTPEIHTWDIYFFKQRNLTLAAI